MPFDTKLQSPRFDYELWLLSVLNFVCSSYFRIGLQKKACRLVSANMNEGLVSSDIPKGNNYSKYFTVHSVQNWTSHSDVLTCE